jgi:hypothetical protein
MVQTSRESFSRDLIGNISAKRNWHVQLQNIQLKEEEFVIIHFIGDRA